MRAVAVFVEETYLPRLQSGCLVLRRRGLCLCQLSGELRLRLLHRRCHRRRCGLALQLAVRLATCRPLCLAISGGLHASGRLPFRGCLRQRGGGGGGGLLCGGGSCCCSGGRLG